jgi:(1->4)-alpha-D-glucan 1-alpha-D-glucosylmutase
VDFAARAGVLAAVEQPDWAELAQSWPTGQIKLAWIRHLMKLRTELADVFALGDYETLEVTGAHRDHVIAFARRHGRDAAIIAVGRSVAPMSGAGRNWPSGDAYQGSVITTDYRVEGADDGASSLPLTGLFQHMPVVVRRARVKGALGATRARR